MKSVITKGMVILGLVTLVAWGGMKEAHAISNGGFETGSFASWTTIGLTSIETAAFGSGPTEGTYQALLRTNIGSIDSVLETFLGLSSGALDGLVVTDGLDGATIGSAIKQTKTALAGDTLSFDFNFLTKEFANEPFFNDTAFVRIFGPSVDVLATLADTFSGLTNSPTTFDLELAAGFQTYSIVLPSNGDYLVGIGIVNVDDSSVDSGLLVDNVVQIGSGANPTPEPSTMLLLGTGLIGLIGYRWKKGQA